jgi:ATP-binding cassette subfamily C (CFTR/MRP) protein 1
MEFTISIRPDEATNVINDQADSMPISLSKTEWMWKGVFYAILLLLVSAFEGIVFQHFMFVTMQTGSKFQASIIQAVYHKSLRLSSTARQESTVGEIVNLMSVDASRFLHIATLSYQAFVGPLQVDMI